MKKYLAVIVILLGFCGCDRAISNAYVSIKDTAVMKQSNQVKGYVVIKEPMDKRIFMTNPPRADIPSLEDPSFKNTSNVVGRQRNGTGKAMANVFLADNKSVEQTIKDVITKVFLENGYYVLNESDEKSKDAMIVNTDIIDFWTFFRPGALKVGVQSNITTALIIGSKNINIKVKEIMKYFYVNHEDYVKVTNKALMTYKEELSKKLQTEF